MGQERRKRQYLICYDLRVCNGQTGSLKKATVFIKRNWKEGSTHE